MPECAKQGDAELPPDVNLIHVGYATKKRTEKRGPLTCPGSVKSAVHLPLAEIGHGEDERHHGHPSFATGTA